MKRCQKHARYYLFSMLMYGLFLSFCYRPFFADAAASIALSLIQKKRRWNNRCSSSRCSNDISSSSSLVVLVDDINLLLLKVTENVTKHLRNPARSLAFATVENDRPTILPTAFEKDLSLKVHSVIYSDTCK